MIGRDRKYGHAESLGVASTKRRKGQRRPFRHRQGKPASHRSGRSRWQEPVDLIKRGMTEPQNHDRCPLAAVDQRLDDLHRLWHQAEKAYFDPDAFRLAIHSAIQTLRSVTFILQKNKAAIPDFDRWYGSWQKKFGADALMVWMRDARNSIEKEGDLEARSFVRAEIVASYLKKWSRGRSSRKALGCTNTTR